MAALGSMSAGHRSPSAADAYRWLTRLIHDFERDPDASIEDITLKVVNV